MFQLMMLRYWCPLRTLKVLKYLQRLRSVNWLLSLLVGEGVMWIRLLYTEKFRVWTQTLSTSRPAHLSPNDFTSSRSKYIFNPLTPIIIKLHLVVWICYLGKCYKNRQGYQLEGDHKNYFVILSIFLSWHACIIFVIKWGCSARHSIS